MKLDELKKDMPDVPDFIHQMICEEVDKQVSEQVVPFERTYIQRWRKKQIAAVAALCILGTSTLAYAGARGYRFYSEKVGGYGLVTKIESTDDCLDTAISSKVHRLTFEPEYIPEGMKWDDEARKLLDINHPDDKGISILSVLLDDKDLGIESIEKNVVLYEKISIDEREYLYLKYDELSVPTGYNQRIYMICPEIQRVVALYITDSVLKEEALKFAEGLRMKEDTELVDAKTMPTWSELCCRDIVDDDESCQQVYDINLPLREIGEEFNVYAAWGTDKEIFETKDLTVCVEDVQIEKDLNKLEKSLLPDEWRKVINKDGMLPDNHLTYIKSGDGVNVLNQIVRERTVPQRLVYATVTYTNHSAQTWNHLNYMVTLMRLKHEQGVFTILEDEKDPEGAYDFYNQDGVANIGEMVYYSEQEEYAGGNYIANLRPGESRKVQMAWIVNEDDLDSLYMNVNNDGETYEFTSAELEGGLVKVLQSK